ncbi:hypothetical protein [Pseudomonas sp. 09C 129]|uniref:hypothetical protein n=1 Tax=Pseudomonas sp. 09C 129 TaxID=2054915 RepID=UPI0012FEC71F|nr:hypothetical protein [Pseudomonas sp. 09C 129]
MPLTSEKDYRYSMQLAALGFLLRHQAEHLGDQGDLFERATNHLVNTLEVPAFMAADLVHLAMGQMTEGKASRLFRLEADPAGAAGGGIVHLVDVLSGDRVPIPLRILPHRFQAYLATQ